MGVLEGVKVGVKVAVGVLRHGGIRVAVDVSISGVGVLTIGGVRVRVPISGRLVVGVFSLSVTLQETSRMLNKMKE